MIARRAGIGFDQDRSGHDQIDVYDLNRIDPNVLMNSKARNAINAVRNKLSCIESREPGAC